MLTVPLLIKVNNKVVWIKKKIEINRYYCSHMNYCSVVVILSKKGYRQIKKQSKKKKRS